MPEIGKQFKEVLLKVQLCLLLCRNLRVPSGIVRAWHPFLGFMYFPPSHCHIPPEQNSNLASPSSIQHDLAIIIISPWCFGAWLLQRSSFHFDAVLFHVQSLKWRNPWNHEVTVKPIGHLPASIDRKTAHLWGCWLIPCFFPSSLLTWGPIDDKWNYQSYLPPWEYFDKQWCTVGNTHFRVVHRGLSTHAGVRCGPSFLDAHYSHWSPPSDCGFLCRLQTECSAFSSLNCWSPESRFHTPLIAFLPQKPAGQPSQIGNERKCCYWVTTLSKTWL